MTPAKKIIKSNNVLAAILQGLAKDIQDMTSTFEADLNKW